MMADGDDVFVGVVELEQEIIRLKETNRSLVAALEKAIEMEARLICCNAIRDPLINAKRGGLT